MLKRSWVVALLYLAITIVMTWPIAARIDRDLPSDLGDPAFVAGVIAWGGEHWLDLLRGDVSAASRFWNAPIFHPEPLALAYSEHFALHSLLTLPAYALTRNPILCHNLAFLGTFVVGALGMYLLVRDLTGRRDEFSAAAFVAGLAFVFAPYRTATVAHLQVLSSHWMPYVLLGLHRYFKSGSSDGLVGAGAALWAQNLSSGYYMLFFGPFVALYASVEMLATGTWRRLATWRDLIVTGVVSLAATLPFALPYLERTRDTRRALSEVIWFSADLKAWLTASSMLHLWGGLQTLAKAEGFLFPGLSVLALALLGLVSGAKRARIAVAFGLVALIVSFWLSLGPQIQSGTQPIGFPSLYRLLWEYVPGYGAVRVPARFATITVLSLALLAGVGLTWFERRRMRWPMIVCGVLILAEGSAFPLPTNGTWSSAPEKVLPAPPNLYRLSEAPPVFRYLAELPESAAIAHLPFGWPEREIQYGYYAMLHGRRIVNGYSGAFPSSYSIRLPALRDPFAAVGALRMVLTLDAVTHAVVHGSAYVDKTEGPRLVALLEELGWRQAAQFNGDYVLTREP